MLLLRTVNRPFMWLLLLVLFVCSCASNRTAFDPARKYAPAELQRDYTLFRNILEESHPSVTWYTSPDSMAWYFDWGYRQLADSLNERQFRAILTYVISKIRCGHTSTRFSKKYLHYLDTANLNYFPLSIKILENDTVLLSNNLQRANQVLPRGTMLTSLNGIPINNFTDSLSKFIPNDGYNASYLRQALSNRGAFGAWIRLVEGFQPAYTLGYLDSTQQEKLLAFRLMEPPKKDSTKRNVIPQIKEKLKRRERKEERLFAARSIQIDTGLSTAYMTVNTFNNGNQLHPFFRNSFHELNKLNIRHLVIDIRGNGGGNVNHSTFLTRLLIDQKFKLADSLYAVSRKSKYGKYIQYRSFSGLFLSIITHRDKNGRYHFGYYERHKFKPRRKDHFDGNVYVLMGPNSFSAAVLFAQAMKGQSNVMLIGEETGGAAYGNTAWFIPNVTLPETGVRFRLPKFRLVIDKNRPKDGRGVLPDLEVRTTRDMFITNRDGKVELVRELIEKHQPKTP
ncbi:S41 family peptidase [Flavihumibacter petaseus]|uniref:Peptidase S41 family protein n=1 Tax=Flavihumibacter petaseus NBRC 106054 TaxID=1220578 RepID=A0A0E9MXM1_9BACT|nr:S41 family peptidase [Flavihumibacter petaseus]GAO42258.1 peptidase S41 family protein [Flavihumibacter petaseus NBRC 106054]